MDDGWGSSRVFVTSAAAGKEIGMSGFNNQLRVIPRIAWILAVVAYLCLGILLFTVALPGDRHMREWNPIGQILFAFGIPLFMIVFVLLVGYVYGDSKRRGMPYVMWTLLGAFHSRWHRHHSLFHFAQASAEAVPCLLAGCVPSFDLYSAPIAALHCNPHAPVAAMP
jgi:hypothetical protein